MRQVNTEQLKLWLEDSKSAEGRRRLLADGGVAAAARGLLLAFVAWHEQCGAAPAAEQLLLSLRLLRNACAAGAPGAACLMRGGLQCVVPAVAADLSARLSSRAVSSPARGDERQLLLAAVQLLANFSVASEAAARAIWRECFPAVYEQLTATDDVDIQAAATLSMLSACKASPAAAAQLAAPAGAGVWRRLLAALVDTGESGADEGGGGDDGAQGAPGKVEESRAVRGGGRGANDCLGLLAKAVALQHGLLSQLMRSLEAPLAGENRAASEAAAAADAAGGRAEGYTRSWRWNGAHVAVLHLLAHEVQRAPAADAAASDAGGACNGAAAATRWPRCALRLVRAAADDVRRAQAGLGGAGGLAAAAAATHALEAAMQLMRAVAQREDGGAPLCGGADAVALMGGFEEVSEDGEQGQQQVGPEQEQQQEQEQEAQEEGEHAAVAEKKEQQQQEQAHEQQGQQQAEQEQQQQQQQEEQQKQQQEQEQEQEKAREGEAASPAAVRAAPEQEQDAEGHEQGREQGACALVDSMLGLLAALGPPINPRRPDASEHARLRGEHLRLLAPRAAALRAAAGAPAAAPYPGYRADVICVLSNALHGRPAAQRAAAAGGAAELLLSSTQLDEAAPVAREWALWGVRNLCAGGGGEEARARMAALQLQDVAAAPELERMGLQVKVDARGKLSVAPQRA
ncbi:hypothetical protein MNEG_6805 [Monoraphidium neglectum]|uniref:Ataxin-10 domain-containing protein n=1 Tax=Monoraphidium neglectum TaxID=145388 RepID=A0A0D2JQ14_9CHLO|nr:hypothetical protein MNEG_6805 [Monoraphidium neglectum]KIZ01153.1 hypothetical protein MNEG_6805 [Monoraphidium neglectum]|eukprot:XP_013900172.1 hypothetical protein MNEG_6805 [Monoraphidium neglectum]